MITKAINRTKPFIVWVILFLLASSIVFNIFLFREAKRFYSQLHAAELDPIGLSYFRDETSPITDDQKLVDFYGDSRAAQWIAPEIDGFHFVNRGIGNQTSAQVLLRFEEHIQPLHPDIVILQVCINDLKTIPLFPERNREIIENCKANITKIIQKSLNINSTVILTTVFPTSGNVPLERKPVWSSDIYEAIGEINEFILNYQNERVIIFDTASILSNSEGNTKPEYVYDLLHLNNAGYDVLNLELIKILKKIEQSQIADPNSQ